MHAYNANTKIWLQFVSFRFISIQFVWFEKQEKEGISTVTKPQRQQQWFAQASTKWIWCVNVWYGSISSTNHMHARKSVPLLLLLHKRNYMCERWRSLAYTHIVIALIVMMYSSFVINWIMKLAVAFVLYVLILLYASRSMYFYFYSYLHGTHAAL